jgi:uncharacterized protein (TIGR03435 family)
MPISTLSAAVLFVAVCQLYGQTAGEPLSFDAASIKPHSETQESRINSEEGIIASKDGGVSALKAGGLLYFGPETVGSTQMGVTARKLILEAYRLTPYQLSGGPDWLDSDAFDLAAKAEASNEHQLRQMLQTLLAERFKLVVHHESKEMPVYVLMAGKSGAKLPEWKQGNPVAMPASSYRYGYRGAGTMQQFADYLSNNAPAVGRPVLDKTGIQGGYVFTFGWDAAEDFIPAMEQQLGLKLESQKAALDAFVIDHIEKPASN